MPLKEFLARTGVTFVIGLGLGLTPNFMHAESAIQLTVVEADSKAPLPGAAVEWTQYPDSKPVQLTTDAAGQCVLPVAEDGKTGYRARASFAGYVPRLVQWNTANPAFQLPKAFTLPLEKAKTIGGVVTDESGGPIAGATVRLIIRTSDSGLSQEIHNDLWEVKCETDDQGRWTFDGAPLAWEHLSARVSHPRYATSERVGGDNKPEEYVAKTARFVMKAGRVIEGTVRDEKGAPLEGVAVLMNEHGAGSITEPSFTTDAAGHYLIENAPDQTPGLMRTGVLLTFFKKGFAPELQLVRPAKGPSKVDVVLAPGRRLTGRVVDAKGAPIEGAYVIPDYWRKARPFRGPRLQTGADGKFVWEEAPADEVVFDVLANGYSALRKVPMTAGKDTTLTMRRPVPVTATVVDAATGAAIPSFTIEPGVQWSDGRKYLGRSGALPGKDGKFQWSFDDPAEVTDRDGKRMDTGAHILRVLAPGYAIADSRPIRDTEESVALEYKLKKSEDLKLRVMSKDGKPAAGAVVAVTGEGNAISIVNGRIPGGGDWITATADESGEATLPAVEGNPLLVAAHPDLGMAEAKLEEARAWGLKLRPWGRVVVKSPAISAAKPRVFYLSDETLMATTAQRPYYVSSTGGMQGDGVQVFEGVKPGKAQIGRSGRPVDQAEDIEVPEGGEITLSLPASDGVASLGGRLILPRGIGAVDWQQQHGGLHSTPNPPPWPEGLTMGELHEWIEKTPAGKEFRKNRRSYPATIMSPGLYSVVDIASGQYTLLIPVYSGQPKDERTLLGVFRKKITIPTREDLARKTGRSDMPDDGLPFLADANPPFYRALAAGDKLPEFTAQGVTGGEMGSAMLKGKKGIVMFYKSIPELLANNSINEIVAAAKAKGIEFLCLNTDNDKAAAKKVLDQHPLACPVAWLGSEEDLVETFGPVWPPLALAVNADGTILGKFASPGEALQALEK